MMGRTSAWVAALLVVAGACAPFPDNTRPAKSTLVIGVDVSGSFREHYDDAIRFAAHYLYGHLNGLGDLRVPTAVFVGSVGGGVPGETKSFQPIHAFRDKNVDEIEETLRSLFPPEDSYTDFNAFFDRVATLVKRQNLILAPVNLVLLSDGIPDVASQTPDGAYTQIELDPLEYLSRNVTIRLLYASPTVSVEWERKVDRQRVRMWTVDALVMQGWRDQLSVDPNLDDQLALWNWVNDNVDFRVRSRRL